MYCSFFERCSLITAMALCALVIFIYALSFGCVTINGTAYETA